MKIPENDNNFCEVVGTVKSLPQISHEIYDEKFYKFSVATQRLSGSFDTISVTVSEKFPIDLIKPDERIYIKGQYRSYNNFSDTGSKLLLTLFVKNIEFDNIPDDINKITLTGYICKKPNYRVTPFKREITDILLAVNRIHNKSDYIPCIAWGRNAKYAENLSVGDKITITGRIQSREYEKKLSENETVIKTAFEISIAEIKKYSE